MDPAVENRCRVDRWAAACAVPRSSNIRCTESFSCCVMTPDFSRSAVLPRTSAAVSCPKELMAEKVLRTSWLLLVNTRRRGGAGGADMGSSSLPRSPLKFAILECGLCISQRS